MTTSGTVSFGLNANQIVEKAFHILGKASEGESLSARMYTDGLSSLNLFLKTLNTIRHLWTQTERTLTLVDSTAAYVLTPRPGRVLSVRRSYSGTEVPLYEMARQQYFDQPNKTLSPSTPVSWYYDPQATTGTLYLWPAPSSSVASLFTLNITYLRRIEDMVASNDALDMPQEWLQTIVWNLANELETEYPVNDSRLALKIERRAGLLLAQLSSWDTEPASIFVQPEYQW